MSDAKSLIFAQFAEIARTLGHAHRLELIEYVAQGEQTVEHLARLTGLSVANTSQHLQHLRRAGFVDCRRKGKYVLYRSGDGPAMALLGALRRFGEHTDAKIRRLVTDYFADMDDLDPVSSDELAERLREGSVVLIDVRPGDEFVQGHLPHARNVPLDELEARLSALPRNREIVAYCRGPYCVLAYKAVAALRAAGFAARRLEEGFPEWKAEGREIERAASA